MLGFMPLITCLPQRSVGARCVGARGRGRRRSPGGVASDRRRRRRRPDRRAHRRPDRLAHRSDRRPNPSGRSARAIRAAERRGRRDPRLVPQQRRRDRVDVPGAGPRRRSRLHLQRHRRARVRRATARLRDCAGDRPRAAGVPRRADRPARGRRLSLIAVARGAATMPRP
jgi:hypothetical protein